VKQHVWLGRVKVAALVAAASLACGRPSPDQDGLPDAVGEWTATSETSEFAGDDLFVYINGGAEIYHEHGFDRLWVREYARGDERVAVELYTMAGSAYGIYSYARSASGRQVDLGAGGTLADYYLHFWSGPHLVAVTARDGPGDAQAAVLELGTLLGAKFPRVGQPPHLMALLPVEECVPGSERYVAGPIGLNNAAPRVAALFRGFEEAAVAHCRSAADEEARLVVLRWADPTAATRAVSEARERAASTEGVNGGPVAEAGFSFRFDEDEIMVGDRAGASVRLAVARGGDESHLDRLFPIDNWEVSHEQQERTQ
jgi:heme-degrading monooxygenase HmoA